MSVLFVTDDVNTNSQNSSIIYPQDYFYKQLKELEYNSLSSKTFFSIIQSSSSISIRINQYNRENCRRRFFRSQQCLVQQLLTYMITLLLLANHIHWSVIFLSLSSVKIMSTYASTTAKMKYLTETSSNKNLYTDALEEQCSPLNNFQIERLCSKTCRARKYPFEKIHNNEQMSLDTYYVPFCSSNLNQILLKSEYLKSKTENQCQEHLHRIKLLDEEAQNAVKLFATYIEAIDFASDDNCYSIRLPDCQKAYRTWACAVKIPYFYQNQRIPPCRTICDQVERVCPTFRPSDREPLFAGQPLFFCNGEIVKNIDYGERPHCFDTCHVHHDSLEQHSSSNQTYSITTGLQNHVTTPMCFTIEPLKSESVDTTISSSHQYVNDFLYNNTNNVTLSASSRTVMPLSTPSSILTCIIIFQTMVLYE